MRRNRYIHVWCVFVFVCVCVCLSVFLSVCLCAYVRERELVCVCVCVRVCVCVHIYAYICTGEEGGGQGRPERIRKNTQQSPGVAILQVVPGLPQFSVTLVYCKLIYQLSVTLVSCKLICENTLPMVPGFVLLLFTPFYGLGKSLSSVLISLSFFLYHLPLPIPTHLSDGARL